MAKKARVTRFSGAYWSDQIKDITVVGAGGIGSWLALNLARIGHNIFLIDDDRVDETNVTGGQMFMKKHINSYKVDCVSSICYEFGSGERSRIFPITARYEESSDLTQICISALDNMETRKKLFNDWLKLQEDGNNEEPYIFIDGRLTMEMFEIFAIQGGDAEAAKMYSKDYLFDDAESNALDCTTKQSTFSAMGIASFITATLCNYLSNAKMGASIREVPFYQRIYMPTFEQRVICSSSESRIAAKVVEGVPEESEVADEEK